MQDLSRGKGSAHPLGNSHFCFHSPSKYKENGLAVIGIHTTSLSDQMAEYVQETNLTWPIALDAEGTTVKAFAADSYCIVKCFFEK